MPRELSDAEAQKLFAEISGAGDDRLKLDELLATPEDDDVVKPDPIVEDKPDEEEDKPDENPTDDANKGADDDEGKDPPDKKPEDDDDKKEDDEDPKIKELRDQLKKLGDENHALKSQAGRVPSMQRKLTDFDKKLEELNKRLSSPSSRPSATIQPKVLEKLKGIRETDPELADAIASAFEVANDGVDTEALNRERATLELLREQQVAEHREEQVNLLLSWYPNAAEVVNSASWAEWKKEQPAEIIGLAQSDNARAVATAFKLYAEAMQEKYPDLVAKQPTAKQASSPNNAEADKAAQIEEERKRRKETSVNTGTPQAPGKVKSPEDPEALFQKLYAEALKARTG